MATGRPAVSAVSVLEESRERGIDLKTLSSENISELEHLKIDTVTKREIKTALNNGKTVIVPEKDICYYQWKGTGYIVLNTDTGEAAYMISGTLCGGSSLEGIGLFAVTILITIAAVFTMCVNSYFMWCGFWAILSAGAFVEELSILQIAILILGAVGFGYAFMSNIEVSRSLKNYLSNPNKENAGEILGEALEVGILFFVFEFALPKVIQGVKASFGKLKEFIKRKWGKGIEIDIPETDLKPDIPPEDDIGLPGGGDIPGGNIPGGGSTPGGSTPGGSIPGGGGGGSTPGIKDNYYDFWKKIADEYGDDIAEQFKAFRDDGENIIRQYGDDAVDIVRGLSGNEVKEAIELINQYGDDAVRLFKQGEKAAQVKGKLETSYEKSSIRLPIVDGKVNGMIPIDEYLEIRGRSLKNAESNSMTLGKYLRNTETGEVLPEAYTEMAKKYGDTYFDLGAEWDVIKGQYGISDADMFELFNIPALDYAVESGKTIRFSQDPTLLIYEDSALADEWNYLMKEHGYSDLEKKAIW